MYWIVKVILFPVLKAILRFTWKIVHPCLLIFAYGIIDDTWAFFRYLTPRFAARIRLSISKGRKIYMNIKSIFDIKNGYIVRHMHII